MFFRRLANLCLALRAGQQHRQKTLEDDVELMWQMVKKYSDFELSNGDHRAHREQHRRDGPAGRTVVCDSERSTNVLELIIRYDRFLQEPQDH